MTTGHTSNKPASLSLLTTPQFAASFIVLVLTLVESVMSLPTTWYMWVLSVVHIILIPCLVWKPRGCSIALLVVFFVSLLLPDHTGPSQFWGVWLALAVIAILSRSIVSLIWPVVATFCRIAESFMFHLPVSESALVIALFFVAWVLGWSLHQRSLAEQAAKDKRHYEMACRQLELARRDRALASRIHDCVTSNLAYLILALDQVNNTSQNTPGGSLNIESIRNKTIETLQEVRTVIDVLDGNRHNGDPFYGVPLEELVRSEIEQGDRYLLDLGFHGRSSLTIDLCHSQISKDVERELLALLRELFTNIALHGSVLLAKYSMQIHISTDVITICETNGSGVSSRCPRWLSSGKGLAFHRAAIESLGGRLNICDEDSAWVFHAEIPRLNCQSI